MAKKKATCPALDAIARKMGQPYFIMAVSHVMDTGYNLLTPENVAETVAEIRATPEAPRAIMSNDFKVYLLESALEIVQAATPLQVVKYAAQFIGDDVYR